MSSPFHNPESVTIKNLESAFAGESMAHIKYRYFARLARASVVNGFSEVDSSDWLTFNPSCCPSHYSSTSTITEPPFAREQLSPGLYPTLPERSKVFRNDSPGAIGTLKK